MVNFMVSPAFTTVYLESKTAVADMGKHFGSSCKDDTADPVFHHYILHRSRNVSHESPASGTAFMTVRHTLKSLTPICRIHQ